MVVGTTCCQGYVNAFGFPLPASLLDGSYPDVLSAEGYMEQSVNNKWRICPLTGLHQMTLPFSYVGVDYFGPFDIKRGRSLVRRYGVIFTCLVIRAVHTAVASCLDTDSFKNALQCFIARRGQVKELHSDNGTNFIGAERELKRAIEGWNLEQIKNTLSLKGIKWTFNPPTGSHHSGAWERLICSIREVLNSTWRAQSLDEEGL